MNAELQFLTALQGLHTPAPGMPSCSSSPGWAMPGLSGLRWRLSCCSSAAPAGPGAFWRWPLCATLYSATSSSSRWCTVSAPVTCCPRQSSSSPTPAITHSPPGTRRPPLPPWLPLWLAGKKRLAGAALCAGRLHRLFPPLPLRPLPHRYPRRRAGGARLRLAGKMAVGIFRSKTSMRKEKPCGSVVEPQGFVVWFRGEQAVLIPAGPLRSPGCARRSGHRRCPRGRPAACPSA